MRKKYPLGVNLVFLTILLLFFISFAGTVAAQRTFSLNPQATKILVDSLARQLQKYYVVKEDALQMGAYLRKRYKEGAYNKIKDPHMLAGLLTADVLTVRRDEHFHVEYNPALANEVLGNIDDVPKMVAEKLKNEREKNFGFKKAEILNGNIGYLELSSFSRLNQYSKATADAALNMLSNAHALIIDLRYGSGGSPDMVNHIISHFFKEKTHITDIYIRSENATLPYWTTPDSGYSPLHTIPIYILTSYKTFSASEGLAYSLQALKRATIIGETTRGGAHTVTYRPLSSGFVSDIPFGRAVNPVTKTNWEGKGLEPDIKVPAGKALETAEDKIFEKLFESARDSAEIHHLNWQYALLQSINHPVQLDTSTLRSFCGKYGPYKVSFDDGQLYYQKTGKARFPLLPMKPFMMRPLGNDSFAIEFNRDSTGKVKQIVTHYDDGRKELAERTE